MSLSRFKLGKVRESFLIMEEFVAPAWGNFFLELLKLKNKVKIVEDPYGIFLYICKD